MTTRPGVRVVEYVTAVPHPRSEAAAPARAGRRSLAARPAVRRARRGRRAARHRPELGGGHRRRWPAAPSPLTAKGSDVTGVPAALAIVGLAALVAVFAVRSAGRFLVAALLALSGAGTVAAALLGASDSSALDEKAAQASGDTSATVDALTHTAWPYVAAAGGAADPARRAARPALRPPVAGHVGPLRARRRPAAAQGPAPVDPDRPEDLWKALDRGEDPTGA